MRSKLCIHSIANQSPDGTYIPGKLILKLAIGLRILADSIQSVSFHEVNRCVGRSSDRRRSQTAGSAHTVATDLVRSCRLAAPDSTVVVMVVVGGLLRAVRVIEIEVL